MDTSKTAESEHNGEGASLVALDSDVAAVFRDSRSVNEALRLLIEVSKRVLEASKAS